MICLYVLDAWNECYHSTITMQRKWNVGSKFNESDASARFPPFQDRWAFVPPKVRRTDRGFAPRVEHRPVGNKEDFNTESILSIWLKMFGETLDLLLWCTNEHGRKRFGKGWVDLDFVTLLEVIAVILRMATHPRKQLFEYFNTVNGDHFITSMSLTRNQFYRVYRALRLYSGEEANRLGLSNR